jgi:2-desacetyl-2-hydroxyethyl bacteriochlorophyllide A dehydrogenase
MMKALVLKGKEQVELVDKAIPEPGPGEALIKVEYCGIGPLDVRAYKTGECPGIILGHEYSGIITRLGPGTVRWHNGQRVASNNVMQCGFCRFCLEGKDNICEENRILGLTVDGALAEYIVVPASSLHEIPDEVSMEEAALAEQVATALHAIKLVGLKYKDRVLVQGAGAQGLITLDLAKAHGARDLIVADIDNQRLAIARDKGATVLNPKEVDLVLKVKDLTEGYGVDYVFDCVGVSASLATSLKITRPGGTVSFLRGNQKPIEVDFDDLLEREIDVKTSLYSTEREFEEALDYLESGDVTAGKYISQIISLEEAAASGFAGKEKGGSNLKTLVKC